MSVLVQRLQAARLYLVCDRPRPGSLTAALRGGVDLVQLRMKGAEDAEIVASAQAVRRACREHGALFILNDRPDLVETVGADGVHLGQEDMPTAPARELVGEGRLIGRSTHTPEQIDAATDEQIDYIGVGPVYETPTKPGRQAVGLELVRYAADHASVPFFAIGGISTANIDAVRDAGAARVAVVRALGQAADPERAAIALRSALIRQEAEVGAAQP